MTYGQSKYSINGQTAARLYGAVAGKILSARSHPCSHSPNVGTRDAQSARIRRLFADRISKKSTQKVNRKGANVFCLLLFFHSFSPKPVSLSFGFISSAPTEKDKYSSASLPVQILASPFFSKITYGSPIYASFSRSTIFFHDTIIAHIFAKLWQTFCHFAFLVRINA